MHHHLAIPPHSLLRIVHMLLLLLLLRTVVALPWGPCNCSRLVDACLTPKLPWTTRFRGIVKGCCVN